MKSDFYFTSHHGKIDNNRQSAGIIFTEVAYAPNSEFPKHAHRDACFCLVHQGGYSEVLGQTALTAKPNSVVFRPPEESHSDHFGKVNVRCSLIEIDSNWFEKLRQDNLILDCPVLFENGEVIWLARRIHREFCQFDELSRLAIEGLTLELLTAATRNLNLKKKSVPPVWLKQVKGFLHEQFSESFTLAELATLAGVHPVYLVNAFRQYFGLSIGEYTRKLRIEFASLQISSTNLPLVEIALSAGFSHQAHFTKVFKRLTGMTPARYRLISRSS